MGGDFVGAFPSSLVISHIDLSGARVEKLLAGWHQLWEFYFQFSNGFCARAGRMRFGVHACEPSLSADSAGIQNV